MTSSQDKRKVLARLKAFKVPPQVAHLLYEQVVIWSRFSGKEWTVGRLKELKVDFGRYHAGLVPVGKYKKHPDGSPYGVFRYFWKLPKQKRYLKMAFKALSLHRLFIGTVPTKAQLQKFYESVQRPRPTGELLFTDKCLAFLRDLPASRRYRDIRASVESGYYRNIRPGRKDEFSTWVTSPSRKAPGIEFTEPAEPTWQPIRRPLKKKELEIELKEHLNFLLFPELDSMRDRLACMLPPACRDYVRSNYPRLKKPHDFFPDMMREFEISGYNEGDVPFHVGLISYIQEPGYKLRAVANPGRVWQYLLAPLADDLFSRIQAIREDFTFNQDAGIAKVQEFVKSGDMIYSVDISDATNNFPLSYTSLILGELYPSGDMKFRANLFRAISAAPWLTPEGQLVRWTVGQPLGLFPSFAAFALSHHALLRSLVEFHGGEYALLGDDVVIRGEGLYQAYLKALESVEVPISWSKTLQSKTAAEFAGKYITAEMVYMGHKYSRCTPDSFFDLVKELGPDFVDTLPLKLRKVVKEFSFLPEPFGYGWNPDGLPLTERIKGIEDIYLGGRPLARGVDRKFVDSFMLSSVMERCIAAARRLQHLPVKEQVEVSLKTRSESNLIGLNLLQRLAEVGLPIAECVRILEAGSRSAYRELDGTLVIRDTDQNRAARDLYFSLTEFPNDKPPSNRYSSIVRMLQELEHFKDD